jgi:type IV secretion system protein VirD4
MADYLFTFPANHRGYSTASYGWALDAWPTVALLGPAAVMALGILLHRMGIGHRSMALTAVIGMAAAAVLTGWPEYRRLWAAVVAGYGPLPVIRAFNAPDGIAILIGLTIAFVGFCVATMVATLGGEHTAPLQRGRSDNFGHADWLSMKDATKLFPGPDKEYGGIVGGEAYRVDQARIARTRFNPRDPKSWGKGGKAPLLIDPCYEKSTHALVVAGSGGFKTTSVGVPTLLTWSGSAVVLDPSCEIGPMVTEYRRQQLGHTVVVLGPETGSQVGVNVLDWIDIKHPLADSHVDDVVSWITKEPPSGGDEEFFKGSGRDLITCLLADLLWDPFLQPEQKTLRTLQRRLVTSEKQMNEFLQRIYEESASPRARDLAGTLIDEHQETFFGVYSNANRGTRWLSVPVYADLVSGGAEGSLAALRTAELTNGNLTVFLQIPMPVLMATPALGRALVGALLNSVYLANGAIKARVLFLLDEVAHLGFMHMLEVARDAGRKYGITLLLLYQSLGQMATQWGVPGKKAWFDSTAWQLFAAVQDWETAREVSAMCGEYTVVSTSMGDSKGSQSRGSMGGSSSTGWSENRSEIKRPLIKPEELRNDARSDEAFVLIGGSRPLRCGRAIWFRPEWAKLVGENRFHRKPST